MFRKALAATIFVACGLCSTAYVAGQDPYADESGMSPLAEKLEQFRRGITGQGETPARRQTAAPSRQARTSKNTRRPQVTPQPQPRAQQPEYDPYADDAELFPGSGIGDFFSHITGRDGNRSQPRQSAGPRAGSMTRQQPPARSSRTSAAGRGMAARTQNYYVQAEPEAEASERESDAEVAPDYRTLQDRLAAARQQQQTRRAPRTPSALPAARTARRPTDEIVEETGWGEDEQPEPSESIPAAPDTPSGPPPAMAEAEQLLITRQSPSISIETAGPKSVKIGKAATYRVSVQNSGDQAGRSVTVSVRVPAWAEVTSTNATTGHAVVSTSTPGLIEWQLDTINARSQEELLVELVPRKSQSFDLAVGWTQQPQVAQATVEVQEPKLHVTIDGPSEVRYGENQLYKLMLSNPGTGAAENVAIRLLPIGQGNEQPATHTIGTLAAGASQTLEIELTPRQAGALVIKAEATGEGGLRSEATQDVLVRRAGLAIAAEGPKAQYAGTTAVYEIQVSNPGNDVAQDVHVKAELPSQAEFIEASGAGRYVADGGAVEWTLPQLQPGAVEVVLLRCTLAAPGVNNLNLTAVAVGDLSTESQAITRVEALADLVLNVTDPRGPIGVGQEVTYEVRVSNRGTKSANGVEVIAFFSEGVEPVSVQGGDHEVSSGQVEFRPVPSIGAGSEVVYTIKARAETAGNHVFRAEVHCKSLGTSLASEETTRFYADGADLGQDGMSPANGENELVPTPIEE